MAFAAFVFALGNVRKFPKPPTCHGVPALRLFYMLLPLGSQVKNKDCVAEWVMLSDPFPFIFISYVFLCVCEMLSAF